MYISQIERMLLQRYQVIEELGSGAFGHTYIAIDTARPSQPRVVVKHLCPLNDNPESLRIAQRLFTTEAEILERLGENNQIPCLYAYFEEDGEFYLVQELIEGHNLTQEFQLGQRWSEAKTVDFLQELLSILSVVHQENIIHRDLKPANIMRRHQDGKLVLIDFGAVSEVMSVDENGQTSIIIGAPFYMPPEQATGRPGKYSDIYAVGMMGIRALTGLPSRDLPHDSEQLQQMWDELNVEVSSQLKYVLGKMISYQYQQRYSNAAEALEALIPTTQIARPTRSTPTKKQGLKKRLFILLGAIVLSGTGITVRAFSNRPDYAQLETYLQNQQWQQADAETDKILLKVGGEKSALDPEAIANFPCKSLAKINGLWQEHSNGRFGFTPQKEAYSATENEFNKYIESTYEAFGNEVGWRELGVWSLYENLKTKKSATPPPGHLPSPGMAADKQNIRYLERGQLLSRFDACRL